MPVLGMHASCQQGVHGVWIRRAKCDSIWTEGQSAAKVS